MQKWFKNLKFQQLFLLLILLSAVFLRFYNLEDSLMFQGDQGRDSLVVSSIFKDLDPVFIGPVTSIGNMYLGPFYYYFMLPFLFLSYPSPMGPVYAVAAVSVLAVFLFFQITKKIFQIKTAYLATIFFTFSAGVVNLARFSWNPNLAPFFSLLMFYFTYQAWKKDSKYWLAVAICFSILIQLHYVTLLAFSGAALILLVQLFEKKKNKKQLIKHVILSIAIFLLSLTPLMLFDYKHDFLNAKSFASIFTKEESFNLEKKAQRYQTSAIYKFLTLDLKDKASKIMFEPSFGVHRLNHPFLFIAFLTSLVYLVKKRFKLPDEEKVLLAFLLPGIVGVSLYQHQVYEHYIAYLFPFVYIFYGLFFAKFKNKWLMLLFLVPFLIFYINNNWSRYHLKDNGWKLSDLEKTSAAIYQRVNNNEKYNIVLLSESKDLYGMNYRYFLSTKENEPVKIEDHHLAEKLFIINEEKVEKNVLDSLIYEIVVFPNKQVEEVFQIENGPEITVLSSYNE